ncbi:MAG: hypothetical protein [Podoviridae sp. ctKoA10]|nr:MAG: hypothetical protein [Podoviridae sp. ctKoA10]
MSLVSSQTPSVITPATIAPHFARSGKTSDYAAILTKTR